MTIDGGRLTRRTILGGALALGVQSLGALGSAVSANRQLTATPRQTMGPFYPRRLPPESDADLARLAGRPAPADGPVIYVGGRVLGADGRPVSDARVELWQANRHGRYAHPEDRSDRPLDPNFQGYGQVRTDHLGRYRFRTIRPGAYGSRTPHIHFRVGGPGFDPLATQMYFADEPGNARDWILRSLRDARQRASVVVDFAPAPDIEAGAEAGHFDIVLGRTA